MNNNKSGDNKCSVVISSFDGRDDIWRPFFTLFFRYWPDCPFPVYLVTGQKKYKDPRVNTILVGEDKNHATNTKKALTRVLTPYVLLMQDDFFLEKITDTGYIKSLVDHAQKSSIGCIGLLPFTEMDDNYTDELNLGKISKSILRISPRATIWDKKVLDNILVDGENLWQMETEGSKRADSVKELLLCVRKPVLHYIFRSALIRGKWMYDGVKLCEKEGIKIDLSRRPIDYEWKWKQRFDSFRKARFIRMFIRIPIIGRILSWFFRHVYSLKINRIFK